MFAYLGFAATKIFRDLSSKPLRTLLVLTLIALLYYFLGSEVAFFVGILLFWAVFAWDLKLVGFAALFGLVCIPILIYLGFQPEANKLATWSFFLLCITILLQVFDYYKTYQLLKKYSRQGQTTTQTVENAPAMLEKIDTEMPKERTQEVQKLQEKEAQQAYQIQEQPSYEILETREKPQFALQENVQENIQENVQQIPQKEAEAAFVPMEETPLPKPFKSARLVEQGSPEVILTAEKLLSQAASQKIKQNGGQPSAAKPNRKKMSFWARFLDFSYQWWPVINFSLLAYILSLSIFRFRSIFSFRDFLALPYNYTSAKFNPFFIAQHHTYLFNRFMDWGYSPELFYSLYFQILFTLGCLISFLTLRKFVQKCQENYGASVRFSTLCCACLSLFHAYNPWTLERFFMGHVFVLWGHFLLLPCLYLIWRWFETSFFSLPTESLQAVPYLERISLGEGDLSQKNSLKFKYSIFLSLAALVLLWFNVHHFFFLLYLFPVLWLSAIFLSRGSKLKKKMDIYQLDQVKVSFWESFWFRKVFLPMLIFLPSLVLLFLQYGLNNPATEFYRTIGQATEGEFIRAFSLKVLADQNWLLRSLIGSGSWNTPTFVEIYQSNTGRPNIQTLLGFWRNFTIFFSPTVTYAFLFLILLMLLGGFLLASWRSYKLNWWLLVSFLLFPISLVLNMGYSFGFRGINQLFYFLPLSYGLREPGKFYSLSLTLLILILIQSFGYLPKFARLLQILILSLIVVSNLLIFWPLNQTVNYIQYPQIFAKVNQTCDSKDKLLVLPPEIYLTTSYSPQVFVVSPATYAFDCSVLTPERITLWDEENQNSNLLLNSNSQDEKVLSAIKNLTESEGETEDREAFWQTLESLQITLLLVEEHQSEQMIKLNLYLNRDKKPLEKDKTWSLYEI